MGLEVVDHARTAIGALGGFTNSLSVAASLDVFPQGLRFTHIIATGIADDAPADRSRTLTY